MSEKKQAKETAKTEVKAKSVAKKVAAKVEDAPKKQDVAESNAAELARATEELTKKNTELLEMRTRISIIRKEIEDLKANVKDLRYKLARSENERKDLEVMLQVMKSKVANYNNIPWYKRAFKKIKC